MSEAEQEEKVSQDPIAGIGTMVFGKWDATDVVCEDPGLAPYINLQTIGTPHSGGRHANEYFGKANLSIIERFINNLMRSGKFSGKKQHCAKAFETALDTINEKTGANPLQNFIDAIKEAAPCEEITRIKMGAVSQPKAVDSSPMRRIDIALRNLSVGCASATAKSKKSLTEGIVSEITKAAQGDVSSYSVGKRDEVERIASSAR
ncbi:MAG: 30S ribosomal protein S7 [Candidatus Thalassarchaeaceae archaeon]|jgi:small subunit ribosomal protein S7|tara:strand:+ start:12262 stop:12876 length:615 start_codon:yes stop_codon:yes gene_type:complete